MASLLPSRRTALLALTGAILLAAAAGGLIYACADRVLAGAKAYLFGYPLVVMDVTRESTEQATGVENRLVRIREFPDARFKYVVRPNVDTLYTFAFIDMAAGPWVFEMPPNDQRYEVMQFMGGWTNVFAAPGTRTTGTAGGRYLLAGPGWKGDAPTGMTLLRAPTRIVWLLGRTQTNGATDYETVHRLQDGLKLHRLAAWNPGRAETEPARKAAGARPPPPAVQMRDMDVETLLHAARDADGRESPSRRRRPDHRHARAPGRRARSGSPLGSHRPLVYEPGAVARRPEDLARTEGAARPRSWLVHATVDRRTLRDGVRSSRRRRHGGPRCQPACRRDLSDDANRRRWPRARRQPPLSPALRPR